MNGVRLGFLLRPINYIQYTAMHFSSKGFSHALLLNSSLIVGVVTRCTIHTFGDCYTSRAFSHSLYTFQAISHSLYTFKLFLSRRPLSSFFSLASLSKCVLTRILSNRFLTRSTCTFQLFLIRRTLSKRFFTRRILSRVFSLTVHFPSVFSLAYTFQIFLTRTLSSVFSLTVHFPSVFFFSFFFFHSYTFKAFFLLPYTFQTFLHSPDTFEASFHLPHSFQEFSHNTILFFKKELLTVHF